MKLYIIKRKKNRVAETIPNQFDKNGATWRCLLLLSDWLHGMCVILTPVVFQFKSQGLGGHLWFWESVRLKPDSTGWDKRTLASSGAVNTCLSFPWFKDEQFTSTVELVTNQFHLDGSQNKLDPASHEHLLRGWEIVEWLVCTTCYIRNYTAINGI